MASERPVLVGVGQLRRRPGLDGGWKPSEPLELMSLAAQAAVADTGVPELIQGVDLIGTVDPIAWTYDGLPGLLAARLGAKPARSEEVPPGGNSPCLLLNNIANRIAEGEVRIAVLAGAEALYSRYRAHREQKSLPWGGRKSTMADTTKGQPPFTSEIERRHGIFLPVQTYPLFENALRAEAGRTVDEHQRVVARMMARFSEVAARNPHAWFPEALTADEIQIVDETNRWICFPYPKRMNAIIAVDMAAALVVTSESEADRLGIPAERRVSYLGGAYATDAWSPAERSDFVSSPAYRSASRAALEHAQLDVDAVDLFDLYSCFPSAVEMALKELSLDPEEPRPLTVTGGLSYAGGPGNNYCTHALANMVEALRRGEGTVGYVSALGMNMTKHAISILSSDAAHAESATGRSEKIELPESERRGPPLVDAPEGSGRIETYTVEFERDNRPRRSLIVVALDDGSRTIAHGEETPEAFASLVEREGVGARGNVVPGSGGDSPNRFVLTG